MKSRTRNSILRKVPELLLLYDALEAKQKQAESTATQIPFVVFQNIPITIPARN